MLTLLPAELSLQIIKYIPTIKDKIELLKTCRHFQQLLSTRVVCWNTLDFSPFHNKLNNTLLLLFLKNHNIFLFTVKNTSHNNNSITGLNLSGCWCLSQDMVVAISTSFPCLHELYLNGYTITKSKEFHQEERMHVYQSRPSHDLSSMSMDLSKNRKNRLNIPYILISTILKRLPQLTKIELQYQDLAPTTGNHFSEFKHVNYLDISSCQINQASIQTMLRHIGHQLTTLKMLNIELNNMTWLCLRQYGKSIACLHVSCNEPAMLSSLKHTVRYLKYLDDIRITRIRTGSLDDIIQTLNPLSLKKLDLSPKMNIYPKVYKKHPPQKTSCYYATTEHDLIVSHLSILHLAQCHRLTELRLCFPTIATSWLQDVFQSLQCLKMFELRLPKEKGEDYLNGLNHLVNLERIYLYSVFISMETIESLCNMNHLKHITMTGGGHLLESKENQSLLLTACKPLVTFNLGELGQSMTSQSTWTPCVVNKIQRECQNLSFFKKDTAWHVT